MAVPPRAYLPVKDKNLVPCCRKGRLGPQPLRNGNKLQPKRDTEQDKPKVLLRCLHLCYVPMG